MKNAKIGVVRLPALLCLLLVAAMFFNGGTVALAAGTEPEPDYIFATYPGTVLPLYDGGCVELDEGVLFAALTRDRHYLVSWFSDGRLSLRDIKNDREALISEDCTSLVDVRDGGLLYTNSENNSYRVLFEESSRLNLGQTLEMKLAEDSMSLLYTDAYDNILSLAEEEREPQLLGVCDSYVCLDGISSDGRLAAWTELRGNKSTVCLSDNGKKTVLAELDTKYCGTWVQFSADEQLMIVASNYSDRMWIKQAGKMPKNVYLGGEAWHDSFYCDEGCIEDFKAKEIEYVYASAEGELYNNLYRVRMNGNAKPILEEVLVYGMAGGWIIYENESGLYAAKLKDAKVSGEEKLSDAAYLPRISPDGEYACYFEDMSDSVGRLVCRSLKDGKSFTVAEDAVGVTDDYLELSPDGKTLFFYREAQRMEEIGMDDYAELWMWSWGDKKPSLIDSEVIIGSLSSGLVEGVEKDGLSYVKYLGMDAEGNIKGQLMYYDGEAKVLDTEIIY